MPRPPRRTILAPWPYTYTPPPRPKPEEAVTSYQQKQAIHNQVASELVNRPVGIYHWPKPAERHRQPNTGDAHEQPYEEPQTPPSRLLNRHHEAGPLVSRDGKSMESMLDMPVFGREAPVQSAQPIFVPLKKLREESANVEKHYKHRHRGATK